MEILFLINHITKLSMKTLNVFSTTHLLITGATRASFREKLYQGLESSKDRHSYRKIWKLYKIFKNDFPNYFYPNSGK